jgi:hypothetical protein
MVTQQALESLRRIDSALATFVGRSLGPSEWRRLDSLRSARLALVAEIEEQGRRRGR